MMEIHYNKDVKYTTSCPVPRSIAKRIHILAEQLRQQRKNRR